MIIISPEGNGHVVKGELGFCEVQTFSDPSMAGPGWHLIAVVYQDEVNFRSVDLVVYEPLHVDNGCRYGGMHSNHTVNNVPVVERTARYLMGRTKDKVLDEAITKAIHAESRAEESDAERIKGVELLRKAETAGEEVIRAGVLREHTIKLLQKKIDEYVIVQDEMMGDISKVRNHIGEGTWKKITRPAEGEGT